MANILRPWPFQLQSTGQIKPEGVPVIDWSHPLARGLISYWYDTGEGFYVDLVTGDTTVLGGISWPTTEASPYGTGFKYTNIAREGLQGSRNFPVQSWAHPYSFATGFYQRAAPTTATAATYFGLADAAGGVPILLYYGSSGTILYAATANEATGINLGGPPANGTFNVVACSTTSSTSKSAWLNGIKTTQSGITQTYAGSNLKPVFNQFRTSSASNDVVGAQVFFGAVWNRQLDDADAQQLYTDPYCFLVSPEPELPMLAGRSRVYINGFETGDTGECGGSSSGTATVQSAIRRSGNYALQITPAASAAYRESTTGLALNSSTFYFRFYVYITAYVSANTGSGAGFAGSANPSDASVIELRMNPTGTIQLWCNAAGQGNTTNAIPLNTWTCIELKHVTTGGAGSTGEIRINGNVELTVNTLNLGTAQFDRVWFQAPFSSLFSGSIYFDDIVCDTAFYPGTDSKIIARQPISFITPTYNAWTKSSGTDIGPLWNQAPFATASNATSATSGAAQTARVSLFSISQTGHGNEVVDVHDEVIVAKSYVVQKSGTASSASNIRRRVNGIDTDTAITLTTSDVMYFQSMWSASLLDLDRIELGVAHGANTNTHTVEDVGVIVEYVPSVPAAAAQTGRVYINGFETGDFSECGGSSGGSSTVQSTRKRAGNFAMSIASGVTGYKESTTGLNLTSCYARLCVYLTAFPASSNTELLSTASATDNTIISTFVTPSGTINVHTFGGTGTDVVLGTGTATLTLNAWNVIELYNYIAGSPNGIVQVRVNGVVDQTYTGIKTDTRGNVDRIYFGALNISMPGTSYFDDIVIDSLGYPGIDSKIISRAPVTGVTPAYNAWTKSSGTDAGALWADVPFNATTNCSSSTSGAAQTADIESWRTTQTGHGNETIADTAVIVAAKAWHVQKSGTASSASFLRARINGLDNDTSITLTTSDAFYQTGLFNISNYAAELIEVGVAHGANANTHTVEDVGFIIEFIPPTVAANDTGAGSASSTSTANAVGASTKDTAGSSSSTSTAAAIGRALFDTAGSASSTSTAAATGNALVARSGSASSTSTATTTGAATVNTSGTASGNGTATAGSTATKDAAGSASGTSTAAATGAATAATQGASSATSNAFAIGQALIIASGQGSASSTSSAAATGAAIVNAQGSAAGIGAANAGSTATAASPGSAAGIGSATAASTATKTAQGAASSTSTAAANSNTLISRSGSASSTSTAAAVSSSLFAAAGSATSASTATAGGTATVAAQGSAAGIGRASGLADVGTSVGSASSTSTAAATGAALIAAAGSSQATSTAAANSAATKTAQGAASSTSTATAAGNANVDRSGSATSTSTAAAVGGAVINAFGSAAASSSASGITTAPDPGVATGSASSTSTATGVGSFIFEEPEPEVLRFGYARVVIPNRW